MIKVLVVEDSLVAQKLLVHILSSGPEIQVIGTANNGEEALEFLARNRPDVITMDIIMPVMDGFETTRRIMETYPVPIIVVSASWDPKEVEKTFKAIESGAVTVLEKPVGIGHPDYDNMAKELVQTVKLMSEVKVVRRKSQFQTKSMPVLDRVLKTPTRRGIKSNVKIIAIGASTGGPVVFQTILSKLPKELAAPVLIVQHIAAGFTRGFANWMNSYSKMPVQLARHGESALPGQVYVAPDDFHMNIGNNGCILLTKEGREYGLRPAVSYLFRSVASVYKQGAVGVILTGMGKDGAKELRMMKDSGAVTIAQDEESSIVYGMPGEAAKLDAATYTLSPDEIVAKLVCLANKQVI